MFGVFFCVRRRKGKELLSLRACWFCWCSILKGAARGSSTNIHWTGGFSVTGRRASAVQGNKYMWESAVSQALRRQQKTGVSCSQALSSGCPQPHWGDVSANTNTRRPKRWMLWERSAWVRCVLGKIHLVPWQQAVSNEGFSQGHEVSFS